MCLRSASKIDIKSFLLFSFVLIVNFRVKKKRELKMNCMLLESCEMTSLTCRLLPIFKAIGGSCLRISIMLSASSVLRGMMRSLVPYEPTVPALLIIRLSNTTSPSSLFSTFPVLLMTTVLKRISRPFCPKSVEAILDTTMYLL